MPWEKVVGGSVVKNAPAGYSGTGLLDYGQRAS